MKPKPPLEKDVQSAIIKYLRAKRLFFWKNNTVGIYKSSTGSYIPSGSVGSPDIFVLKDGLLYGLEVKRIGGKQSDAQINFGWSMNYHGGRYEVVFSIDDVIKLGL